LTAMERDGGEKKKRFREKFPLKSRGKGGKEPKGTDKSTNYVEETELTEQSDQFAWKPYTLLQQRNVKREEIQRKSKALVG